MSDEAQALQRHGGPGPGKLGKPHPTMSDVAARCGLSIKSVSRVVNGEPGVSATTARRVLEVIDELGFRRNDLARGLRRGHGTGTIALILKDPATHFYDQVIRGVQAVTQRRNALTLTVSVLEPEREKQTVLSLLSHRVDGLLIVPTSPDHSYLTVEARLGVPMVFIDRPPGGLEADVVLLDNAGGAAAAVAHLIERGHQRIAVVGDSASIFPVSERVKGYRRALRRAGLRFDPALVALGNTTAAQAEEAARRLLDAAVPPTAFFTTNNRSTIGVYRAMSSFPQARGLVGFDDFELADLLRPPVTVVAHDTTELGRIGAEVLFARMAGDTSPPKRLVLGTRLVVREAGDAAR